MVFRVAGQCFRARGPRTQTPSACGPLSGEAPSDVGAHARPNRLSGTLQGEAAHGSRAPEE
eukprot:15252946-Alexandrium_andersonii.AAC.1